MYDRIRIRINANGIRCFSLTMTLNETISFPDHADCFGSGCMRDTAREGNRIVAGWRIKQTPDAICSAHILILTMKNQFWKTSSGLKWCEFTIGIFSPAPCFDFGSQLMDSSEKQPLKWHYFRSVHKNCVAIQPLPRKWDSSVTEHQCSAWSCQADQPSGNLPDNSPW